jgi:septum formation protein
MIENRNCEPSFANIYLASQSPRRQELLRQLGVGFIMLLADPDEDAEALEAELPGEPADAYVVRVCAAKASAAVTRRQRRKLPHAPILVADTTVAIDGMILGKPRDTAHAVAMLSRLAGRRHQVLTAVAVVPAAADGAEPILSVSHVRVAAMCVAEIARYAASGEPLGKAGGYGIQGRAAAFIEHIEGSYSGIMGLPLFETAALLRAARALF